MTYKTESTETTTHWLLAGQMSYPKLAQKFMGFTLVVSLYLGSVILIVTAGMLVANIMTSLFGTAPAGDSLTEASILFQIR